MKDFDVEYDVDLKKYNTYGIGGIAKYLIRPHSLKELQDIIYCLKENDIKYLVLGGGSNVILPDENFDGAIIKLDFLNDFYLTDEFIYAEAGLSLASFIKKTLEADAVNFAPLFGIPGNLGGALVGNIGANGKNIYDDVLSVLVLDQDKIKLIPKKNIKYEYRSTEFKNDNRIILGGVFKKEIGDVKKAQEMITKNLEIRKEKQPLEYKNAGSVFKNPDNTSAGKIIDELGLKGFRVNDAMISQKHGNFIINLGNAQSRDIIKLIEIIKEEVRKKENIELELEQIIVKW